MAILMVVGLLGCTTHSSSEPQPATAPPIADSLDPKVVAKLAYLDSLRTLDPCGFLDPAALEQIARPAYIGAAGEFDSCTADFGGEVGPKRIAKVEFDMGMIGQTGFGTPVEVGGTTIRVADSGGEFCSAHLRFDDQQTVAIRVFTAPLAPPADLCPEAIDLATASIPLLGTRPPRSGSTHAHIDTRLARLDACDVVQTLGHDRSDLDAGGLNPWGCWFRLDAADESTQQQITFLRASDANIGKRSGAELTEIGGFPATYQAGTGKYSASCELILGVDAQRRSKLERITGPDIDIELIRVNTTGGGCDNAKTTATELVRLYRLLG
ncbi:DUF3558 family protein [Nocardia salmonicida]|uniref:DUF3558 family protein n=1 Tax=Nocardia salmonicida TaxID=53431 RepID=UPI003434ED88